MPLTPDEQAAFEERFQALEDRNAKLERLIRSGRAFTNNPLALTTDLDDLGSVKTHLDFEESPLVPVTPPADVLRIYAEDVGGTTVLKFTGPIAVDTLQEFTSAAGVDIDGVRMLDEFIELTEVSAPGAGSANVLRLYALDGPATATGGRATVPSFVDSAGTTTILDSGIYTPTLTNQANAAASTAFEAQWMRVGNAVTVAGKFNCDPTSANILTQLGISLPVASNFTAEEECGGAVGCRTTTGSGLVFADSTNDRAFTQFYPTSVNNSAWGFIFLYQVI